MSLLVILQSFTLLSVLYLIYLTRKEGVTMNTDLTTLQKDVAAETTVEASVIVLLQNLTQAVKDAGTDPIALKAVTDQIEANTAALSAAVLANTPTPASTGDTAAVAS